MSYHNPLTALLVSLFHSYPHLSLDERLTILASVLYAVEPKNKLLVQIEKKITRAREYEIVISIMKELYRQGEIEELRLGKEYEELRKLEVKILGSIIQRYMGGSSADIKDRLLGR